MLQLIKVTKFYHEQFIINFRIYLKYFSAFLNIFNIFSVEKLN